MKFMHDHGVGVKLQPDHKLVYRAEWEDGVERLRGARSLVRELADVATGKEPVLPPTASGDAMPRLNIGKPKAPPPAPIKKAHAPTTPAAFKQQPRGGFGKRGR